MHSFDVQIDVTEAAGFGMPQHLIGTVHLPEKRSKGRQVVIFATPGGGYTRQYFDMRFDGHEDYSEAEYHTGRGIVFVAIDHLGVGESSIDRIDDITVEKIADCNDAYVREIVSRLEAGTLSDALPAIVSPFIVGIGQSMGGGITMIMQGRTETFDAIAPLGISAIHTVIPQPSPEQFKAARDLFMFSRQTPLSQLAVSNTGAHIPDFNYPFHWEDEPEDIRLDDLKGGYPTRTTAPPYGSLTIPRCAVAMNSPGFYTPEVARITVPVLMAGGIRDVSADMRREPSAFINSDDVSIFMVPRMAHMHNFANTRTMLWQRVADWSEMQSRRIVAV